MEEKRKFPLAVEVISQQPRRENNGPDKGGGNPHMNWDDKPLSESETWEVPRITKAREAGEEVSP